MKELINKIDFDCIRESLGNLKIKSPTYLINLFNSEPIKLKIGTVQLTYKNNEYSVSKIYLTRNDKIEIVLDKNYKFSSFNFFTKDKCFAYDSKGILLYSYDMSKSDILLEKSNGDIYYLPDKPIDNLYLNKIRIKWEKTLLCYSQKLDGRNCFYIQIRINSIFSCNPFYL